MGGVRDSLQGALHCTAQLGRQHDCRLTVQGIRPVHGTCSGSSGACCRLTLLLTQGALTLCQCFAAAAGVGTLM